MFTGLVEATGALRSKVRRGPGYRVSIEAALGALELGESIAVSGACLTVVGADSAGFEADVSVETHERTTLGEVSVGGRVNLERSLRIGDRLGGHLVSGHVDGIAVVRGVESAGEALRVTLRAPAGPLRFVAEKGSVTLDGVSLTVNRVVDDGFEVMVIPHTAQVTTLDELASGRRLNLEVDLIARYVARLLAAGDGSEGLRSALERAGFVAPAVGPKESR